MKATGGALLKLPSGLLALTLLTFACAAPASATYDPIGSGTTKLTLDKGFLSFLQENGIALSAKAGAKRNVDPTIGMGGGQLKVATSAKRSSARSGFGTRYSVKQLKLTAKVATRLNKKLRPEAPFAQGQIVGTLITNAQPRLVTILAQGRATVLLDPAFAARWTPSSSGRRWGL